MRGLSVRRRDFDDSRRRYFHGGDAGVEVIHFWEKLVEEAPVIDAKWIEPAAGGRWRRLIMHVDSQCGGVSHRQCAWELASRPPCRASSGPGSHSL